MPPTIRAPSTRAAWAWSLIALLLCTAPLAVLLPRSTDAALTLLKPPNNLGLVGYWSFNEGAGTVATDFSGNGNHGTLQNSPTWIGGKRGKALDFGGATDRVVVTGTSVLRPSSITVSGWIKIADTTSIEQDIIGSAGNTNGYRLVVNNEDVECDNNAIGFFIRRGGDFCASYAFSNFTPSAWNHFVGTYDGETVVLYVNGVQVDSNTDPSGAIDQDTSAFCIGQRASSDTACNQSATNFGGSVDEVRVYNRALTAAQVAKLYQSGAVRVNASSADLDNGSSLETNLLGHWTFDGADTQATMADRSGNARHGSVIGAATSSMKTVGKLGQGLQFSGLGNYINTSSVASPSQGTVALWLKGSNLANDTNRVWGNDTNFEFVILSSGDARFDICGATSFNVGPDLQDGVWYHIAVAWNDVTETQRIYYDGTLIPSVDATIDCAQTDVFRIAGQPDASTDESFGGILDDVRFYNRALSAAEVKQLYNLGTVRIRQ